MTVNQKDLARMAGVAVSTVSRALNGRPGVSEETRERILSLAEEHNYRPNKMAQGLAKQKTNMLALLLPDLKSPSHHLIIEAVEAVIEDSGYHIVICNTQRDETKGKNYLDLLKYNQFDGALIVGGTRPGRKLVELSWEKDNNMVLINQLVEELALPSHLVNYRQEGRLAAGALMKSAGRSADSSSPLVMLSGHHRDYVEEERREGFAEYCRERGMNNFRVFEDINTREEGYQAFLQVIEELYPLPAGFYLTSNLTAAGLMEAIKMGGYMVPEDFEVVGTGDNYMADMIKPELTLVDEPLEEIAAEAARTLLGLVEDEQPQEMIKVYDPSIRWGNTTKK